MTDDKLKVYFPRSRAGQLPDPTTGVLRTICINEEWLPFLQGQLHHLRWRGKLWDGSKEEIDENHQYVEKLLSLLSGKGCNVITDLRIFNGRLEAQYCDNPTWVLIGRVMAGGIRKVGNVLQYDLDGDGSFEVSQFIDASQNFYGAGLPVADDDDKICRASWLLARAICDDYKDMIQIMRGVTNAIFVGVEWLASFIPFQATIVTNIETLHGLVGETAMDFLDSNIQDPETIELVAQNIYCALKEAFPDDLENFWDYVDFGPYEPVITYDAVETVVQMVNHELLINTIVAVAQGKNTGYLALAYGKASSEVGLEATGLVKPLDQILTYALSTAQYFDQRDCGQFPCNQWEQIFDFTQNDGGWSPGFGNGRATYVNGVGWEAASVDTDVVAIKYNLPPGAYVNTTVEIFITEPLDGDANDWYALMGAYNSSGIFASDAGALSKIKDPVSLSPGEFMVYVDKNTGNNSGIYAGAIWKVIIRGTGTNPFL